MSQRIVVLPVPDWMYSEENTRERFEAYVNEQLEHGRQYCGTGLTACGIISGLCFLEEVDHAVQP